MATDCTEWVTCCTFTVYNVWTVGWCGCLVKLVFFCWGGGGKLIQVAIGYNVMTTSITCVQYNAVHECLLPPALCFSGEGGGRAWVESHCIDQLAWRNICIKVCNVIWYMRSRVHASQSARTHTLISLYYVPRFVGAECYCKAQNVSGNIISRLWHLREVRGNWFSQVNSAQQWNS